MDDLKVIELIENIVNGFNKTLNERFDKVDQRLDKVEQRLDNVDQRLDKVEQRLDNVEHRLDKMEPQLEAISKKLDFTIVEVAGLREDVTMLKKEEFEFQIKRVK